MAENVEGFNESGVITVKDEVVVFLKNAAHTSPPVSFKLVEDDKQTGQVFKITISDDEQIVKGSVNLTVVPVPNGSLISLSPYAPFPHNEQSLRLGTVDSFLRQAVAFSGLETRQHFEVFMHTTYVTKGFTEAEPVLSKVLDEVGEAMLKARHDFQPDSASKRAAASIKFREPRTASFDKTI